jgi:SAM-dependent methyltransferase
MHRIERLPSNHRPSIRGLTSRLPLRYPHSWFAHIGRVEVADLRGRVTRLPIVRRLRCAQFRRLHPLANGRQRGTPIVRHYWTQFLEKHRPDIRGRGLEIGTTETIRRYGGSALIAADAIDLAPHNPEVTVVADLTKADELPSDAYDCFVNQFTMHLIYDVDSALYHSLRLLKPGGVLLSNFPSVEYCFDRGLDMGTGGRLFVFWQFTPIHVENLLRRCGLADADFELELFGNLFARVAYQMNMPADELTRAELEHVDPGHPLLICARVVKPADWNVPRPEPVTPWLPDVAPARWDPVTGHYAA